MKPWYVGAYFMNTTQGNRVRDSEPILEWEWDNEPLILCRSGERYPALYLPKNWILA